jgi:hypothetical protein
MKEDCVGGAWVIEMTKRKWLEKRRLGRPRDGWRNSIKLNSLEIG